MLADQHEAFVDLFGADLIVVPGIEVPGKVEEFQRYWASGSTLMLSLLSLPSMELSR